MTTAWPHNAASERGGRAAGSPPPAFSTFCLPPLPAYLDYHHTTHLPHHHHATPHHTWPACPPPHHLSPTCHYPPTTTAALTRQHHHHPYPTPPALPAPAPTHGGACHAFGFGRKGGGRWRATAPPFETCADCLEGQLVHGHKPDLPVSGVSQLHAQYQQFMNIVRFHGGFPPRARPS